MSFQQKIVDFLRSSEFFAQCFSDNSPKISWEINFDRYFTLSSGTESNDQIVVLEYDYGFYTYKEIDTFLKGMKAVLNTGKIVIKKAEDLPSGNENQIHPTRVQLVYQYSLPSTDFLTENNLCKIEECLSEIFSLKELQKGILITRTKAVYHN